MMKFLKIIDIIILLMISVFAIIISLMDTFNINDSSEMFKKINYSMLAVLLLGLIGLHLAVSFLKDTYFQEKAEKELAQIVPSLKGSKINVFESTEEMENYLARKIRMAKHEICDLTWKKSISLSYDLPNRKRSRKYYDNSIKFVSKNVEYKEVFVFSDYRRIEKLKARVEENREGYSCKYYPENSNIPRLQFVLIDRKEVIFASSSYQQLIAIENEDLGKLLKRYFEDVWDNGIFIMNGKLVDWDVYNSILTSYDL